MNESCVKHNNKKKKTAYNYINLRDAIFECGLTNTELAKRIGVDKSRVSDWTNGYGFPNEKNLQKLLIVLNGIQESKGLEPYSIEYLRGDHNGINLEYQDIYKKTHLEYNAIQTVNNLAEKDIDKNALIPVDPYNHFTYVGTANYVISQNEFWETFYAETKRILLEIKQQHSGIETYKDVVNSLDVYNSAELNKSMNNILNNYIKELLRLYFPDEQK